MKNQGELVKMQVVLMVMDGEVTVAPPFVQLLPYGYHKTEKGDFLVDEEAVVDILAYYSSREVDPVIDYEHQTLTGKEAPAAAWIKGMESRGAAGIWSPVRWCPRAKGMVESGEYRYLSPVFMKDPVTNRVKYILHAALTNTPCIDGMTPIVNKSETGGNAEHSKEELITMKNIAEALGLAATATETEVMGAITALKTAAGKVTVACKGVLTALGLNEGAKEPEVVGTIMAMKSGSDQTSGLAAQVKTLSTKLAEREATELVQMAMTAGKITPAQNDWAKNYATTDPEGFKVFMAKAATVVQMGDKGKQPAAPADSAAADLTPAELMVCKQLGIAEADFKKTKKA